MSHVHVVCNGKVAPSTRVPQSLQHVILASNRGIDVLVPPPQRAGNKIFYRGFLNRTYSSDSALDPTRKKNDHERAPFRLLLSRRKSVDSLPVAEPTVSSQRDVLQKVARVPVPTLSPQQYLNSMLSNRGYSIASYPALGTAYHSKPSPLQLASYGAYVIHLVKTGNVEDLRAALGCGLCSNASNAYGESLLHLICRQGDDSMQLLEVMIAAGCNLQVVDESGCTLLHYACWAKAEPAFLMVHTLLSCDRNLFFMEDARGALPLSYVKQKHWSQWLQFLVAQKDVIWPKVVGDLPLSPPRPMEAPANTLTLGLARLVANGKVTPEEAHCMMAATDDMESSDSSTHDDDEACLSDNDNGSWSQIEMEIVENASLKDPV